MADVPEILSRARPEDLQLDRFGRVVVTNPELGQAIKESVTLRPSGEELAGNGICCGNGNCASEMLVSLLERVVGGRAPG